jgi:hypothetical protein
MNDEDVTMRILRDDFIKAAAWHREQGNTAASVVLERLALTVEDVSRDFQTALTNIFLGHEGNGVDIVEREMMRDPDIAYSDANAFISDFVPKYYTRLEEMEEDDGAESFTRGKGEPPREGF